MATTLPDFSAQIQIGARRINAGGGGSVPFTVENGDPFLLNGVGDTLISVENGFLVLSATPAPTFTRTGGVLPFPTMQVLPPETTLVDGVPTYVTTPGVEQVLFPGDAETVQSLDLVRLGEAAFNCPDTLVSFAFPAFVGDAAQAVTIDGAPSALVLASFDLSGLETAASINIAVAQPMPELTEASFPALTGPDVISITFANPCAAFTTLDVPELLGLQLTIDAANLPAFTTLNADSATLANVSITGEFDTPWSVAFPAVTHLSLDIRDTLNLVGVTIDGAVTAGALSCVNAPDLATLEAPNLVSVDAIAIEQCTALEEALFSALLHLVDGGVSVVDNTSLTTLDLSALQDAASIAISGCNLLTTVDLEALVSVTSGGLSVHSNAGLTSLTLSAALLLLDSDVICSANALTEASIDNILARIAALDGTGGTTSWDSHILDLTGGTNAPPSLIGEADVVTIVGRGNLFAINTNYPITAAAADPVNTLTISGNHAALFSLAAVVFSVTGSTGNDGNYSVASAIFGAGVTVITTNEALPDSTADGAITLMSNN